MTNNEKRAEEVMSAIGRIQIQAEQNGDTVVERATEVRQYIASALNAAQAEGYKLGAEKMREFSALRKANQERQKLWDADNKISLTYRGNELGGECGELQNILKKLERAKLGLKGSRATLEQAAQELGDVIICADLIAADLGIDLWEATRSKFNTTSKKHGFDVAIPITPPQPAAHADVHKVYSTTWGGGIEEHNPEDCEVVDGLLYVKKKSQPAAKAEDDEREMREAFEKWFLREFNFSVQREESSEEYLFHAAKIAWAAWKESGVLARFRNT